MVQILIPCSPLILTLEWYVRVQKTFHVILFDPQQPSEIGRTRSHSFFLHERKTKLTDARDLFEAMLGSWIRTLFLLSLWFLPATSPVKVLIGLEQELLEGHLPKNSNGDKGTILQLGKSPGRCIYPTSKTSNSALEALASNCGMQTDIIITLLTKLQLQFFFNN